MINIDFDPDHLHVPSDKETHDAAESSVSTISELKFNIYLVDFNSVF